MPCASLLPDTEPSATGLSVPTMCSQSPNITHTEDTPHRTHSWGNHRWLFHLEPTGPSLSLSLQAAWTPTQIKPPKLENEALGTPHTYPPFSNTIHFKWPTHYECTCKASVDHWHFTWPKKDLGVNKEQRIKGEQSWQIWVEPSPHRMKASLTTLSNLRASSNAYKQTHWCN